MVSSTLKLGISILNGGNADVQQVMGEGTWEGSWEGWEVPVRPPVPPPLPPPLQKMLDYLKDKKEVGFFQSIQALMQTCRWALVHIFSEAAWCSRAPSPRTTSGSRSVLLVPGTETHSDQLK